MPAHLQQGPAIAQAMKKAPTETTSLGIIRGRPKSGRVVGPISLKPTRYTGPCSSREKEETLLRGGDSVLSRVQDSTDLLTVNHPERNSFDFQVKVCEVVEEDDVTHFHLVAEFARTNGQDLPLAPVLVLCCLRDDDASVRHLLGAQVLHQYAISDGFDGLACLLYCFCSHVIL